MGRSGSLSLEQRSAILDTALREYAGRGYRLVTRDATTAWLVRTKRVDWRRAMFFLALFFVGAVFYVLDALMRPPEVLILEVDEFGTVRRERRPASR